MDKRNLYYIDIIRMICCLAVFIEHFTASFATSYLTAFRNITGKTMFSYLNDGRLAINMFCTISGFLIIYHAIDGNNINFDKVRFSLIKRFLYLYIPCAVVCILSFYVIKLGMLGNKKAFELGADQYIVGIYFQETSLENLIWCLKGILRGLTAFSPQLWTMYIEIWGGSVCFLILLIAGNKKSIRWFFYVVYFIVVTFVLHDNYFEAFVCGMIVAELCKKNIVLKNRIVGYIGVLMSLNLATYSYKTQGNWVYLIPVFSAIFIYLGYGLWSEKEKLIWPLEKMRLFGKYSYSFYMVHFTFIVSMSAWFYVFFIGKFGMLITYIINFTLSLSIITVFAVLFQKLFVNNLNKYIKKIYMKLK